MNVERPLILVSNDDGITAPGLRCLIKIMNTLGEVVVVAPDSPQSGMGHAITINSPLYLNEIKIDGLQKEYSCSGTSADCVKIGINEVLKRKPDLCVSGINHGSNASINVVYSGTVSAAVEAGIEGIPSIGFSILDYNWNTSFSHIEKYVKNIAQNVLKNGLPLDTVLNVNFPKDNIRSMRVCKQAKAYWKEEFDKRTTPQNQYYYWLSGNLVCNNKTDDTDIWALNNNYGSIVPVMFDLTAHKAIDDIKKWNLNE